jgi:hypothetical protein
MPSKQAKYVPNLSEIEQTAKNTFTNKRSAVDAMVHQLVARTNGDIYLKFRELGMDYVPFKLVYNSRPVLRELKKVNDTWYKKFRTARSIRLEIDHKFTKAYFQKKITFESWLSSKYPEVSKIHYFHIRNMGEEHPNISKYIAEFNREVPVEKQHPKLQSDHNKASILAAHITEKRAETVQEYRIFKSFTGEQLSKFLENEKYIFSGQLLNKKAEPNMAKFFKADTNTSDIINKVLKEVLTKFNDDFLEFDLNNILESKHMKEKYTEYNSPRSEQHQKWLEELPEIEAQWKVKPKFPNIKNIRTWFLKTGLFKSYRFNDFQNIKTVKGRKSFIDSSIFLIANGIYTRKLGQKTFKYTRDPETPNASFRKYRETAGAKIKASTMMRRSKLDIRSRRRKDKYDNWDKEIERISRGWNNRGTKYSRIRRTSGNTRKPRKDPR